MNVISNKDKTNLTFLTGSIYLAVLLLVGLNRSPHINFSPYFIIFYDSMFCFIIYFFANPFKWTKELASSRKLSDNAYILKRNIVIGFMMLIIVLKVCHVYYVNHNIFPDSTFDAERKSIRLIMLIPGGFFEEMFFKGVLLRLFKMFRLNDVICFVVISFLFALAHLIFSGAFFYFFLVSFISLLLFKLYPSIIFFSVFHVMWNVASCLINF